MVNDVNQIFSCVVAWLTLLMPVAEVVITSVTEYGNLNTFWYFISFDIVQNSFNGI